MVWSSCSILPFDVSSKSEPTAMSRQIPVVLFLASVALFLLALTQDGYYIEGSNPRAWAPAWGLLLIGWLGLFYGVFAWVANPLMAAGWLLCGLKKYRAGGALAAMAMLFMLSFLLHSTVISSEAPTYSRISGYGPGYWLWIASAATLLLANAAAMILQPVATPTDQSTRSR
jgi:hypothetical protein